MSLLRFILPFLFVRNWYDGKWELSRARCILFSTLLLLLFLALWIIFELQAPVVYTSHS